MTHKHTSLRSLTFLLLAITSLRADDWPNFRGPAHSGISAEKGWRAEWPADGPPVAWKAEVGLGFSNIVVAKTRAATVGHADGKDTVFCFDAASGKPLWKHSYPAQLGDTFFEGGTTGTPTFEGDRLYWLSRWGDLICFDAADGKIVWQTNIQKDTGAPLPTWGYTGAPLVQGNLLVLNVGSAGAAVDKATGKLAWKSDAKDAGYSTPLPLTRDGKTLVILANSENYVAVDPTSGAEAWRFKWLTQYGVNAADPVAGDDKLFISTGYGKGSALLQLGTGAPQQLWKTKLLRTQLNAAVLHNGHLYGADGDTTEKAALKCVEFATGKEKWAEPGFGNGGVLVADGKLIALSAVGELMIAPASPDGFKPTTRAQVLGAKCWTAPVLANGFIYCRTSKGQIAVLDVRAK
ncbi:MAG: PQQ-binding-like beta-propeller repeat protein [Chthoniobacteraceae bacterium]